jgi:drug/metabolite transporter (DMT)-like permease
MSTVGYSGLFGWMVMGERLSTTGLTGAALLLGGAAFTAIRQAQQPAALSPSATAQGTAERTG